MLLISASVVARIAAMSPKHTVPKYLESSWARAILNFVLLFWVLERMSGYITPADIEITILSCFCLLMARITVPCLAFICRLLTQEDLFYFLKQHHQFDWTFIT
jgi:hypothetical protein